MKNISNERVLKAERSDEAVGRTRRFCLVFVNEENLIEGGLSKISD